MATSKRPAFVKGFSPAGIAVFPSLNKPDFKYKKDTGEFKVKLRVTDDEAQPLADKVTALAAAHFDLTQTQLTEQLAEATDGKKKAALKKALTELKLADISITDDVDDEGDPNGFKLINFKSPGCYNSVKDKDADGEPKKVPIKITIVDGKGIELKNPPEIWGGSKLVVAYELRPFYTDKAGVGISLRLTAVQIIELRTKGQGGATPAFGAVEGAYEGSGGGDDEGPAFAPRGDDDEPAGPVAGGDAF